MDQRGQNHHHQQQRVNGPPANRQLGTSPDCAAEHDGIAQIEKAFADPKKDLCQTNGDGPPAQLHIVADLRLNDVSKGFHRLIGGKTEEIRVIVRDQRG